MIWWAQIVVLAIASACFPMLLSIYRRQDAMQPIFKVSILLAIASLIVPDAVVFIPVLWLSILILRAGNFRVYMASLMGVLVVAMYAALIWRIWPDSYLVTTTISRVMESLCREVGIHIYPLWTQITSGALCLIGLWAIIAHFSRYPVANVRIQTRILLAFLPMVVSLVSVLLPPVNQSNLLLVLWAILLYYPILYIATYGFPRLPSFKRSNPYRRSFKRRRRR